MASTVLPMTLLLSPLLLWIRWRTGMTEESSLLQRCSEKEAALLGVVTWVCTPCTTCYDKSPVAAFTENSTHRYNNISVPWLPIATPPHTLPLASLHPHTLRFSHWPLWPHTVRSPPHEQGCPACRNIAPRPWGSCCTSSLPTQQQCSCTDVAFTSRG